MARCFNAAWEILEKKRRSPADAQRMLDMAHAARFHAGIIGTARNHAIGDWQISRVYASLGEPRLALQYARSTRSICENQGVSDLLCTAFEAMARAYAVGNRASSAKRFLDKAQRQLDRTALDAEGQGIFSSQLRDTGKLVRRANSRRASG
jgi:hypothetical protein